jgi:hypothetical protein
MSQSRSMRGRLRWMGDRWTESNLDRASLTVRWCGGKWAWSLRGSKIRPEGMRATAAGKSEPGIDKRNELPANSESGSAER